MSPQPIDFQTFVGQHEVAEKVQAMQVRQASQQPDRAAAEGLIRSAEGETQVSETRQTEASEITDPRFRVVPRKRRKKKEGEEEAEEQVGENQAEGEEDEEGMIYESREKKITESNVEGRNLDVRI